VSDTPRMQSALMDAPDAGFVKIWQVGCDIERELHAANAEIERLTNKVAQLYEGAEQQKQRIKRLEEELNELRSDEARLLNLNGELERCIKRLEEAGDALGNNHNPFTFIDWLKAKEAK
jgi:chromosome segregation ATPase